MANLHFHYGTMGCSKTAQLVINAYNQNKNGNKNRFYSILILRRWRKSKSAQIRLCHKKFAFTYFSKQVKYIRIMDSALPQNIERREPYGGTKI